MAPPQPGGRSGMIVYNYVTVETEDDAYENVVAVQNGDALGIVPDPGELEREYGRGSGPDPAKLFEAHSRYVVPWRRVVEIDRAAGDPGTASSGSGPGSGGTDGGGTTGDTDDGPDPGENGDDDPDNVFDEV